MDSSQRRSIAAGSIAGAIQPLLFNPIDTLRIRWQVAQSQASLLSFTRGVINRDGFVRGLYRPGLPMNVMAVASSQGLRLGLYPSVRDAISPPGGSAIRPDLMAVAALLSGALGYTVAAPLFLLKTRAQASVQLGTRFSYPATPFGLWLGCSPLVIRGAMLTAGQMAGYDGSKKVVKANGWLHDGPLLHLIAAVCAAFCPAVALAVALLRLFRGAGGRGGGQRDTLPRAFRVPSAGASTLAAPADVLQTRLQSASHEGASVSAIRTAMAIVREGAAFRGWAANLLRLAPTFVVGSTIFEQVRMHLGLGYM